MLKKTYISIFLYFFASSAVAYDPDVSMLVMSRRMLEEDMQQVMEFLTIAFDPSVDPAAAEFYSQKMRLETELASLITDRERIVSDAVFTKGRPYQDKLEGLERSEKRIREELAEVRSKLARFAVGGDWIDWVGVHYTTLYQEQSFTGAREYAEALENAKDAAAESLAFLRENPEIFNTLRNDPSDATKAQFLKILEPQLRLRVVLAKNPALLQSIAQGETHPKLRRWRRLSSGMSIAVGLLGGVASFSLRDMPCLSAGCAVVLSFAVPSLTHALLNATLESSVDDYARQRLAAAVDVATVELLNHAKIDALPRSPEALAVSTLISHHTTPAFQRALGDVMRAQAGACGVSGIQGKLEQQQRAKDLNEEDPPTATILQQ